MTVYVTDYGGSYDNACELHSESSRLEFRAGHRLS
jgi:hypothetical protein